MDPGTKTTERSVTQCSTFQLQLKRLLQECGCLTGLKAIFISALPCPPQKMLCLAGLQDVLEREMLILNLDSFVTTLRHSSYMEM